MSKRGRIYLALFLLAAVGLGYWELWGEPWYRWRPLSGWLADYGEGPDDYQPSPKADEALRHFGPKAVPHLLRLLRATNSPAEAKKLEAWIANPYQPAPTNTLAKAEHRFMDLMEKYTPMRFQAAPPASWKHWQAYVAFQALGPLGRSAIPDLATLARDPGGVSNFPKLNDIKVMAQLAQSSQSYRSVGDSPYVGRRQNAKSNGKTVIYGGLGSSFGRGKNSFLLDGEIAALSLAAIGAEAVPSLQELLADPSPRLKARAAATLALIGPAAEPAVPELLKYVKHPDLEGWTR